MIINGDCLLELKKLKENSVDSCVTDPPYELGFMGKSWDSTGIANNVDMWKEVLRVLKPGGHLLSFGGTRTYHRMACAIEDAGFEIRDQIQWIYGSGFPKSHNIGKNIEKMKVGGIKNLKKIGTKKGIKVETGTQGFSYSKEYVPGKSMGGKQISGDIPVYEITNKWEGWGTALKPANEPIVLARKPLSEKTIALNVLKWGTGGINIDESRVAPTNDVSGWSKTGSKESENTSMSGKNYDRKPKPDNLTGRFPANLIHDGSDEVVSRFPSSKDGVASLKSRPYGDGNIFGKYDKDLKSNSRGYGGSGSASRFFYCAKASKSERHAGLEGFDEQTTDDGRQKSIDNAYQRGETVRKNNHPTVKPVKLMRYLIKLITPPNGTVLDPFMGSGTTGVACDGFKFIGIEMDEEYCKIAKARINQNKQLSLANNQIR